MYNTAIPISNEQRLTNFGICNNNLLIDGFEKMRNVWINGRHTQYTLCATDNKDLRLITWKELEEEVMNLKLCLLNVI